MPLNRTAHCITGYRMHLFILRILFTCSSSASFPLKYRKDYLVPSLVSWKFPVYQGRLGAIAFVILVAVSRMYRIHDNYDGLLWLPHFHGK